MCRVKRVVFTMSLSDAWQRQIAGRAGGGSEGFSCHGLRSWLDLKCMLAMGLGYLGYLSGSWGLIALYFDFVFTFSDMAVLLPATSWLLRSGIFP